MERSREMKEYILTIHDSLHHVPEKPERTGMGQLNWSVKYIVYPNREALAKVIRRQERRGYSPYDITPYIKLSDGEGYKKRY
jgi:hypothetical protein